jgi:RNase P subunit RPR2
MKIYVLVLFSLIYFLACQSKGPQKKSLNPNGDSELAILMRQMFDETMKMKEAQEKGEKYKPALDLQDILKAHPTEEGKNETPEYRAYAQQYLQVMEQYAQAKDHRIESGYQAVVDNCKACHSAICPGPLMKIRHLEI